jgi:hypothetical protein
MRMAADATRMVEPHFHCHREKTFGLRSGPKVFDAISLFEEGDSVVSLVPIRSA